MSARDVRVRRAPDEMSNAMTKPTAPTAVRSRRFDPIDPHIAGARRFDGPVTLSSPEQETDPLDATLAVADAFPSRAVVRIMSNRGSCTGWLFGPDIVATAGHCVNAGGQPGQAAAWADLDSMWIATHVVDGDTGIVPAGEPFRARRLYASQGWIDAAADDQDFGAIRLVDSRLGERLGWLGITSSTVVRPGTPIRLTGFMKADLDNPYANLPAEHAAYAKCIRRSHVTGTRDGRLLFDADTHPGDSGSPVASAGCDGCALAILTGRSPEHAAANSLARQAALISRSSFETLMAWREAETRIG
jgi:glutamyl endopeptidase